MSSKPVIAVAFYSTWGHIATLAESVIKGVESTGVTVKPYVFQETLPEEVRTKMHAAPIANYPVIKPNDLTSVDGLIIGAPTRYGRLPAQVSTFFDACGQLWATGALVGKPVTLFTSVAGQHGGHETTALTSMPFFVHQGMIYVPIGYSNQDISGLDHVQGGSPYGASTVAAGDGSRQPLANELATAEYQGKYFADFVTTLHRGRQLVASDRNTATGKDAAREMPAKVTEGGEKHSGYAVPAAATVATTGGASGVDSATPQVKEQASVPSQTLGTTATGSSPAGAGVGPTPRKEVKKKGGLFASCCGGRGIDD